MQPLKPIQLQGSRFTVATTQQLLAAGIIPWRLRASDLEAPMRGVRTAPDIDGFSADAKAAALKLVLTPGQFISRRSAAELLGIPTPKPPNTVIPASSRIQPAPPSTNPQRPRPKQRAHPPVFMSWEVGAVRPRRPPERIGLQGHQIQPGVLSRLPAGPDWLPTPADTWALMAAVVTVEELIVAADHLVSTTRKSKSPGCTLEELQDALNRFARCQGVHRMREALTRTRLGVASPPETLTRLAIVHAGLPEPITNCPVPTRERTLHADLGYPHWRIAIEYDGAYHFENGARQAKFDTARRELMRHAGWRVFTLTSLDLKDPTDFLIGLREAINAASR